MYAKEKLDKLARQSLDRESRHCERYRDRMGLIADQVAPNLIKGYRLDTRYLRTLGIPLVWVTLKDYLAPLDLIALDRLEPATRLELVNRLAHDLRDCEGHFHEFLNQQRTRTALECLFDFDDYDVLREEFHALEEMKAVTDEPWRLSEQSPVHSFLACLWDAARVHFELGVAGRALLQPGHPLYKEATEWCRRGEFQGRQDFLAGVIKRAREKIERNWEVACHRYEEADLGKLASIEDAFDGLVWPPPQPHNQQMPLSNQLVTGYFKDFFAKYDVAPMENRFQRLQRDREHHEDLIGLFYNIQEKLQQALLPEEDLLLSLERDHATGLINDFSFAETETRLQNNWVSSAWCYLQCFETLHERLSGIPAPELPSAELGERLAVIYPEDYPRTLHKWIEDHPVHKALTKLQRLDDEATSATSLQKLLNCFQEFQLALHHFRPEAMPLGMISQLEEDAAQTLDLQLGRYYDLILDMQRTRRHTESVIAGAYVKLIGKVDLSELEHNHCRDLLVRHIRFRLNHGDYTPISKSWLNRLADSGSEPKEQKLRQCLADHVLKHLPSIGELVSNGAYLDQSTESVWRRSKFLPQVYREFHLLGLRVRAKLGREASVSGSREARYRFLSMNPQRVENWREHFQILVNQADRAASAAALIAVARLLIRLGYEVESQLDPTSKKLKDKKLIPSHIKTWLGGELAVEQHAAESLITQLTHTLEDMSQRYRSVGGRDVFPKYPGLNRLKVLKKDLHLVDAAPPDWVSHLYTITQHRRHQLDELFSQMKMHSQKVPEPLRQIYSKRFHMVWRNERRVAPALRVHVLHHVPVVFKVEVSYLALILCMMQPKSPLDVPELRAVLEMFSLKGQQLQPLLAWLYENLFGELAIFEGDAFTQNFNHNLTALLELASEYSEPEPVTRGHS